MDGRKLRPLQLWAFPKGPGRIMSAANRGCLFLCGDPHVCNRDNCDDQDQDQRTSSRNRECTTTLFSVSPLHGLALTIATLALGWSRIHLKQHTLQQHTLQQVTAAWAFAVVSVMIVFPVYH